MGEEEARAVGEEIEQVQRRGHNLEEIAILVRASFQNAQFEERFITLGPALSRHRRTALFNERAEIRDALAYLRCMAQPADDLAFDTHRQHAQARAVGDATLQMLHEFGRRESMPLMQAARIPCRERRDQAQAARLHCARCWRISSAGAR